MFALSWLFSYYDWRNWEREEKHIWKNKRLKESPCFLFWVIALCPGLVCTADFASGAKPGQTALCIVKMSTVTGFSYTENLHGKGYSVYHLMYTPRSISI